MGLPSRALRKLATFDASGRLWYLQSKLFDAWALRYMKPADLFHVWGNYGLRSLQRAKDLGSVTAVQRASSHPLYQARILRDEHSRWGVDYQLPKAGLHRAVAEIEAADYVLIPSEFVRSTFLEQGYPAGRLLMLPFGVDPNRFRPGAHKEPHPFRVLFVGQISIRKGVQYLLQAWQELGWRDAELWLVGRMKSHFHPLWERWKGLPGVRLVDYTSNPVRVYQQADLFAFPSIEEGSALVTYEAMACGLPVVTTSNAGSVVRDGLEGFVVPIRDVGQLAQRLEQLRLDESLRREQSRVARRRAEAFTWDRSGELLAREYERIGSK